MKRPRRPGERLDTEAGLIVLLLIVVVLWLIPAPGAVCPAWNTAETPGVTGSRPTETTRVSALFRYRLPLRAQAGNRPGL